ncbi:hypothetical protein LP419_24235 [Massilia sp. H-1]|nr:hypothetical protein LP419_24235 [Massilia sp. H-1]
MIENGERLGTVFLRAEYRIVSRALEYAAVALGVILLALLIAFLLTRRLGQILTAPILSISEVARDVVASRDYAQRAQRISDDETGELTDSFNAMLSEIEARTGALEYSNQALAREADERAPPGRSDAPERAPRRARPGTHPPARSDQ